MIFDDYLEKRSVRDIARMLKERNIVSRKGSPLTESFVFHVLRSPANAGMILHKDKLYPGQHPGIVSQTSLSTSKP
jgi:site-specific DNA recombinase